VTYNYRLLDRKQLSLPARKRLESTMSAKITGIVHCLAASTVLHVLAVPLPGAVLKTLAATLQPDEDDEAGVIERLPARHRKEVAAICDEIRTLRRQRSAASVFVLYSSEDHNFATLMLPA
jgi:hypothetical protein